MIVVDVIYDDDVFFSHLSSWKPYRNVVSFVMTRFFLVEHDSLIKSDRVTLLSDILIVKCWDNGSPADKPYIFEREGGEPSTSKITDRICMWLTVGSYQKLKDLTKGSSEYRWNDGDWFEGCFKYHEVAIFEKQIRSHMVLVLLPFCSIMELRTEEIYHYRHICLIRVLRNVM